MHQTVLPCLVLILLCCAWSCTSESSQRSRGERSVASDAASESADGSRLESSRPEAQETQFKDVEGGRGETSDGTEFSFHLYVGPDNVGISTIIEKRGSPARARQEMRKKVGNAERVVERGPKLDDNGRRVGERAVVILPAQQSFRPQAAVIWTNGPDLFYIESPSIGYVLSFEKKYYQR